MKTPPLWSALAILPLAATACFHTGNGIDKTEARALPAGEKGFDRVEAAGWIDVDVTVGAAERVDVRCDENLLQHIHTEVAGGLLKIRTDNMIMGDSHVPCAVHVSLPAIRSVAASGSGDVQVHGSSEGLDTIDTSGSGNVTVEDARVDELHITTSGSGDVKVVRITTNTLSAEASGSGNVSLSGAAARATFLCSGSGDIRARKLATWDADASSSGSCDITLAASRSLAADVSGSGDVRVAGRPPEHRESKSGSGSIKFE
jgi:putative autotransporter adhesin-like protein